MKIYEAILQARQQGKRNALEVQEAVRALCPHAICGLDYVQRILREAAKREEAK